MLIDFYLWAYMGNRYMSIPVHISGAYLLTLLLTICLGLKLLGHIVSVSSGSVINAKKFYFLIAALIFTPIGSI